MREFGSAIEAIVLDVGGVLLLPDPVAFREHLAPFGVCPSDEECARAHYVGMAVIDELGTADFLQASRSIVRLFGVAEEVHEAASAAVDTAYKSSWVPVAGAGAQLRRLQAAGVSLAVVSNATGAVEAELAGHGICAVAGGCVGKGLPEVAVVIDSCVVGVEKPDPAIFSLALEVLDVAAERCMYVGDSVHFDVNGALAAGLHPVHLTAVAGCPGNHLHYRALSDFVDAFLGT